MIQVFLVGASTVYGVGAHTSGFADLVKQAINATLYSKDGIGEKIEVFNFGKSGATIDFVIDSFPVQKKQYGRNGTLITVVSVGGNNMKAHGTPEAFVSTPEEYTQQMAALLDLLHDQSDHVIAVGSGWYDESKTNPKISPFTGGNSFFTNSRKKQFQSIFRDLCEKRSITFIEPEVSEEEWKQKYLYADGLHPNQAGHQLLADMVMGKLTSLLKKAVGK